MARQRIEGVIAARQELNADRTRPVWLERGHSLPFGMLADDEFEVFCYLLLVREHPDDKIYYYGKTGDAGRDIVHHRAGGTADLVQCKRYASNVGVGEVRGELAKLCTNLDSGVLPEPFHRVIFYVATDLSAPAQDLLASVKNWQKVAVRSLREHLGAEPSRKLRVFAKAWRPEFGWETGLKLTTRALQYPDLVEEFFAARKVVDARALAPIVEQGRETHAKLDALLARPGESKGSPPHFEGPGGGPALPVARFFGREVELAALRDALREDHASAGAVVTGLGGVGKTALVHHFVATEARELFPDGVWWLDARALAAEFQRMLVRLERPSAADEDEARTALARALHHQHALVVLDDVDSSEVDPHRLLLPGGHCRTVCTTRIATLADQLGTRVTSVALGCWSLATARDYLRGVPPNATVTGAELEALAGHVGCLPLALQLLSWWLRRPGITFDVLRERLARDSLGTLDRFAKVVGRGVAQTFLVSFEALPSRERGVLLALAACAQGTSAQTVATVAGLGTDEAVVALGELWDRSFAEHTESTETPWGVHDLVRLFLQTQDGAESGEEAHVRYCKEQLQQLHRAKATDGFDRVIPEVLAATDRAITRRQWRAAWELLAEVDERLRRRARHQDLVVRYERMLPIVLPESIEAGTISGNLGLCYRALGRLDRAVELITHALETAVRLQDRKEEATQLSNLGICESAQGHTRLAAGHLQRALNLSIELEELHLAVNALTNLALCHLNLSDPGQAAPKFRKALEIAERRGWAEEQANLLANIGICERQLGRPREAIGLFERALALEEKLGRLSGVAGAHGNLGNCYSELHDAARAFDHYRRALAIEEKIGREEGVALAHGNLGSIYASRAEFDLALQHFRSALEIDERLGLRDGQALVLGNLGHTYLLLEDHVQAQACLERALALDEALERPERIAGHLCGLGACAEARGELLRATDLLLRALAIESRLQSPHRQITCLLGLGSTFRGLGQFERSATFIERALALSTSAGLSDDDPAVLQMREEFQVTQAALRAGVGQAPWRSDAGGPPEAQSADGSTGPAVRSTAPRPRRS